MRFNNIFVFFKLTSNGPFRRAMRLGGPNPAPDYSPFLESCQPYRLRYFSRSIITCSLLRILMTADVRGTARMTSHFRLIQRFCRITSRTLNENVVNIAHLQMAGNRRVGPVSFEIMLKIFLVTFPFRWTFVQC